jgi:bifunctional non-homologous end joining protein LigD
MGGVLASWAVPRGPTLDPSARRLAVHLEDHPLEYGDFEGVIPGPQYGAGDVIVWDRGTWEPELTDDPVAAVRAGELKFRLHGARLSGRFTIVRTGTAWLLVKKRDAAAVEGWDPEAYPRSVLSGLTNEEVAAGANVAGRTERRPGGGWAAGTDVAGARPGPMPEFVEPMKATLATAPFSDPDWLFEVKWDGYRVETVVREGRVRLWTRHRHDAAAYFPALAGPPSWIDADEAIVDGEVVALRPDGTADFGALQALAGIERPGPGAGAPAVLAYEVFDLLYLDGASLLGVALEERKRLLRRVLRDHPVVRYAGHVGGEGEAFYAEAVRRGVEGMVAKLRRSTYEPGRRSRAWLKLKGRPEQELVVGGYVPGQGRAARLGALAVGVYEEDGLRYAGRVGSGFDDAGRTALASRLDAIRRPDSPFIGAPPLANAIWVEPVVVVRAEFAGWTADGLVRQAAYKGLEPGRDARTVRRERPRGRTSVAQHNAPVVESDEAPAPDPPQPRSPVEPASPEELAALDGLPPKAGRWSVGGRDVPLTNLDRVLFPAEGITKRDLIRYYATIGPTLLPYLAGRALNVSRWPNGIDGQSFWQKEVPGWAPGWVERRHIAGRTPAESHTYVLADSIATLAWLANQAAIEIHPWTSLAEAPDRPTYALIDIDPGERTTWQETVLLARLYGDALRHLGVRGFPKTTGRRGIQIWIPVRPVYTFDQTRAWIEALSRAVAAAAPELISWEWDRSSRRGLARLDYTQNALNRTLVGPYVVRAQPHASVSAPIGWDELDDPDLRADRWTMRTIGQRLAVRGDLFRGALDAAGELPPL